MRLSSFSEFSPVEISTLIAEVVPKLVEAAEESTALVQERAQEKVPVDTGELKASIETTVEIHGTSVDGYVEATADHAAYVEFGTGIRGAASAGAGEGITYSSTWPGMPAQPYMRPAIDESGDEILGIYQSKFK